MEISAFWIYLIGTLGSIKTSLGFCVFLLFMVVISSGIFLAVIYGQTDLFERTKEEQEKRNTLIKVFKRILITSSITWILLGLFCTFLPTPKTVVAMITVPAIVNNEEVQKLPKNIISFVNEYLETEIYRYKNQRKEDDL